MLCLTRQIAPKRQMNSQNIIWSLSPPLSSRLANTRALLCRFCALSHVVFLAEISLYRDYEGVSRFTKGFLASVPLSVISILIEFPSEFTVLLSFSLFFSAKEETGHLNFPELSRGHYPEVAIPRSLPRGRYPEALSLGRYPEVTIPRSLSWGRYPEVAIPRSLYRGRYP